MTDAEAFSHRLDQVVRRLVGDRLVGTYLHGSAALGGFVPGRSDIDLLVIVDGPVDGPGLADALVASAEQCPGRGIELSVVDAAVATRPVPPWPFVVHVTTDPPGPRIVDGSDCDGDPDLALHVAVCRATGIAISGPPAAQLFGEVDDPTIVEALRRELAWAVESADSTYAVLNACRAWCYARTGALVSKLEGAEWAAEHVEPEDASLVELALDRQLGRGEYSPARPASDRFVRSVLRRLTAP